ncbi:MAG: YCF48-related protein [Bacteroidota bacterium]
MKLKYWLFTALICISVLNLNAQDWRQVLTKSESSISGAYFLNSLTGWFVDDDGLVKKTVDGGQTWEVLNTGITEDLDAAFFLDANTGFVGGSGNKIFKTVDGGATWTPIDVAVTVTSSTIESIYFENQTNGWILSSKSSAAQVVQTTDGGATWNIVVDNPSGDLEAMDFYDATSGIVVGGGSGKLDIYFTTNGSTWTKATAPTLPPTVTYSRTDIKGVYMVDKNLAYAVGWGTAAAGLQPSIHIKTTDGGATWTYLEQAEANRTYDNLYDVYFKDASNGIAIGGATKGSIAVRTNDGGINWVPIDFECGATLNTLDGFNDDLIVTSSSGIVFTSSDFGSTWELLTSAPSATLYSVSAPSDNIIYAGGADGLLFKSTDGGKNWKGSYIYVDKVASNIQSLHFINENVGYAAHSYRLVSKTTDGGTTWNKVVADTNAATVTQYGVFFLDENNGYVVGKAGSNADIIYKTTNGGQTWEIKTGIANANLRGVAFANSQVGVIVSEKQKILYTTDSGANWQLATINNAPTTDANLYDVVFLSSTVAIVAGDNVMLKTTDGGANWDNVSINDLNQKLTGISFNNNNVWATGYKSSKPKSIGLWQSTDNGQSWTNKVDYSVHDSLTSVNDIAVSPSGYVTVCANNSIIYSNSPLTGVENENNEIPLMFSLEQNYPNPFNPSTTIGYKLQAPSYVTLKVYDVLGREVATLINEFQNPGNYNLKLSANNYQLSTGVYFYQLKAGSMVQTKKMIYLK